MLAARAVPPLPGASVSQQCAAFNSFLKPLLLGRYFTPKEDGKFTALWFYVVPLDEHSTRVINHAVIVQPLPGLVKRLAAARPRWIDHLLLNEIFDGDMAYLAKACTFLLPRSHVVCSPGSRSLCRACNSACLA